MTLPATLVGRIESVVGSVLQIRLLDSVSSTLVLVGGESHRIGQIGSFLRIPLGLAHIYAIVTQVGAKAAPPELVEAGHSARWVSATMFGEAMSSTFQRGVGQYPTVGDHVHLVTAADLEVIYGSATSNAFAEVGTIAGSVGIPARLRLDPLVTRHAAVVGSTGAGKSTFVTTLIGAMCKAELPSARLLVIDPHGEYGAPLMDLAHVLRARTRVATDERLVVPYWAMGFEELAAAAFGALPLSAEGFVRDDLSSLRKKSAVANSLQIEPDRISADSPIPFSVNRLWFELCDIEERTFNKAQGVEPLAPTTAGNAEELRSNVYPRASAGGGAPFLNPGRRQIARQLELLRARLKDRRFAFLFDLPAELKPDNEGRVQKDLASLVQSWVGHDRIATVLDLAGTPAEMLSIVVGAILQVVYEALFWADDLPIGGRSQPLLIVIDEAHLVLPSGKETIAHRIIRRIAKEGRKYGVGLCIVTQRPTEVDPTVLSQCGTLVALRTTNHADRSCVEGMMQDDLGALGALLPALRTGEGIVLGDAMPIPSRVRFLQGSRRPQGDDPVVAAAWRRARETNGWEEAYKKAVRRWRQRGLDDE